MGIVTKHFAALAPDELQRRWPSACQPDGPETRREHVRLGPFRAALLWEPEWPFWFVLIGSAWGSVAWSEFGIGRPSK